MGEYLDALWNDLEQTWDLAMKVNDLSEKERGDVEAAWQEFKKSENMKRINDMNTVRESV